MVRLGSSTSPVVYALGGFAGLFTLIFTVSELDFIKSKSVEMVLPITILPFTVFYLYKIATGFKINYNRKFFYFSDIHGLPKNTRNVSNFSNPPNTYSKNLLNCKPKCSLWGRYRC